MATAAENYAYRAKMRELDPDWNKKQYSLSRDRFNSDKTKFVANKISKQKDAARRRNIPWELVTETLVKRLLRTTHCALSGRELVFQIGHLDGPSIDRKNSSKGYTSRNIQIVSRSVNIAKNTLSDRAFIQLCKDIAQHNK